MTIFLIIVAWYLSGLLGMAMAFWALDYRRGYDIDMSDVGFGMFMALLGPLTFLAGLLFAIGALFQWGATAVGIDWRRTVIRGKRRS